ncbi:MAG: selenide, water dikinase SelD [Alphaproteobacteria bacterium]|nr:selenide, water dikinase SelD [Alphaproteobacteria bacterium]
MNNSEIPVVKDIVLVGGGHSHVAVLKRFGMNPAPGIRITLICRDIHTPYSGMLPGFVAGHYDYDDAHIDLGALARFAGGRFYHNAVTGLDLVNRKVLCDGRPDVPYELLSINIGSAPHMANVPGAAETVTPVKPINQFLDKWNALRTRATAQDGPLRIAVVGAGAGGVELLPAIQFRLKKLRTDAGFTGPDIEYHLFTDTPDILPTHDDRVRATFRKVLDQRNVTLHTGHAVREISSGRLVTDDGQSFETDEILWVTAAGAAPWLAQTGLALDDQGFIAVSDSLQSISHPEVFAAGDIAAVKNHPRPKSGVFAVRQGPPLAENLRRLALGQTPKPFTPQKQFLGLITTGDKYAVASRGTWSVKGRLVWMWKDWIDRRFMKKFNDLPDMIEATKTKLPPGLANADVVKEISAIAMRCGGCGAKVGATVLGRALNTLTPVPRPDVLIGLHEPDDAAVVEIPPGKVVVQTVDSFRAMIDDPYQFGKIAANHSLGDIYAMGAEPQTALAIATVPFGLEAKVEDTLTQMMSGAMEILNDAGAALVGGHTSEGAELSLGFAINGLIDRDKVMRKGGLIPGDVLVVTKPIGTGTLFAADMRHKAKGRWIVAALESMVQSNRTGADCLLAHDAHACTDVTGFGLLGHLVEMVRASGVDVDLDLSAIPYMEGAEETVRNGIVSSLQPQNVRLRRAIANLDDAAQDPRYPLIFDPQTAGGLLASIPEARAEDCVAALKALGYGRSAIIGRVKPESDALEPITILR